MRERGTDERTAVAVAGDESLRATVTDALATAEDLRVVEGADADCLVTDLAGLPAAPPAATVVYDDVPPEDVPPAVAYVRRTDGSRGHLRDRIRRVVTSEGGPTGGLDPATGDLDPATVVETMLDGVIVVDADHRIRGVNAAARGTLGSDAGAAVGESIDWLATTGVLTAETAASLATLVDDMLADPPASRSLELTLGPDDPEPLDVELRLTTLPPSAPFAGVLATVRDITARRATEATLRETTAKIEALHAVASEMVACEDHAAVYDLIVDAAEGILEFDICGVDVVEDGVFVPVAVSEEMEATGYEGGDSSEGIAGRTYQDGESIVVDDLTETGADPAAAAYRSVLSVPLGDHGIFQAAATTVGAFDDRDRELAELLMAHAAETIDRLDAEARLRERREKIERLHESTAEIVAARDESELHSLTVDAAENVLDFDVTAVFVATDDDRLRTVASSGGPAAPDVGETVPRDYGLAGETLQTGESYLVRDAAEHDRAAPRGETYRSALSLPLGDDGVFQGISTAVGAYDEEDRELAALLVSHVAETRQRIRAEAELTRERDSLRALFENVPDPVVRYSLEDGVPIVRDVNGPFEETFGYAAEEIVGENIDEYIVPPDQEAEADRLNAELAAGNRLQTTTRRLTSEGVRDVLLHVVPLRIGEANPRGYSIYTDITEQKRRERELEAQNERLDEFASIVSHDLRNPLSVAQGNLELARETGDEERFERVVDAHDRMGEMIDQLLSLAREGEIVGETAALDLATVAEAAWATVQTDGASLQIVETGTVVADRDRLVELFENLLRNAVDHAAEDPATLSVAVGTTDAGFYVEDDGRGIPEEDRDAVFDSGYTTATDGTGFGLAIVDRIATAHGWSVTVGESAAGGARFEFTVDADGVGSD